MLAIKATGKTTHADYRDKLMLKAQALMAKGLIRMLYVIGHDFTGFKLEALRDDSRFRLEY